MANILVQCITRADPGSTSAAVLKIYHQPKIFKISLQDFDPQGTIGILQTLPLCEAFINV